MRKSAITYKDYAKAHPATKKKPNDPMFSDEVEKNHSQQQAPQKQKSQSARPKEPTTNRRNDPKNSVSGSPEIDNKVSTYLDKMKAVVDKARASGDKPPDFDLCEVSVPGTNLFCGSNKGIPRKNMPQLKGNPEKGSKAESLSKDSAGEVSIEQPFVDSLIQKNIKLTNKTVEASQLKATQSQLVGSKVVGMIDALKKDPKNKNITAPIFVSKDGYVLDGHHRWAAMVGLNFSSNEPVQMNIVEVDLDINELVKYTNDFADEMGIRQKAAKLRKIAQRIRLLKTY